MDSKKCTNQSQYLESDLYMPLEHTLIIHLEKKKFMRNLKNYFKKLVIFL